MNYNNDPTRGDPISWSGNGQRPILVAEHLKKNYDSRPALRGLSFSLRSGRILGFLGPNGAGKTTAIRILTTILEPTSGQFHVDGISSEHPERIRHRIGVLPESLGFPQQNTAVEFLTYYGQLYGRSTKDARTVAESLLHEVGLQQRAHSLIGSFSRGMRQRLGIARALVNDPAVVFLDEPTLGLDPRGQQELLALIRRIARERNAGVILCSHLLREIEEVCDDVVILRGGQVVALGTVGEVVGRAQNNQIRIHVPPAKVAEAQRTLEALPALVAVVRAGEMGDWLELKLKDTAVDQNAIGDEVRAAILNALLSANIPVLSFEAEGGRLQDVFLQLTEEVIA